MSKAFADLVSSWLPATEPSAGWLSGIAGESSGGRRCSHSSAVEVAHPRRLRSFPSKGISASTYKEHGFQFLASFGSLRCRFCCRVYVRVKIQTGNVPFRLTSKIQGAIIEASLGVRSRSFKDRKRASKWRVPVALLGRFYLTKNPAKHQNKFLEERRKSDILGARAGYEKNES